MASTGAPNSQTNAAASSGPIPPSFSYPGGPVIQIAENTHAVTMDMVYASPPPPIPKVYTITGGADAALFTIDANNGLLSFIEAPDYEAPRDLGVGAGNNTYQVEVTRQDGAGTASQLLTVWIRDVDERPGTAPQTRLDDRREVTVRTVTESDGTQRQLLSIATSANPNVPFDPNDITGFDIVLDASGGAVLRAERLDGIGLEASGSTTPKAASASLGDLLREIRAHSEAGSASQAGLVEGATAYLAGLAPDAQVLLQTLTPVLDFGQPIYGVPQLVLSSAQQGDDQPLSALVIDTRGVWRAGVNLDHIDFVAISGEITIGGTLSNGLGNQTLVADSAAQTLNTGDGDDVVHAGGGDDIIDGGAGNDRLFGDDGDDTITGGAGDDWIDGGAGSDTVRLSGTRADYTMRVEQGHVVIAARGNGDGVDAVANVELLNFGGAGYDPSTRGTIARLISTLEDRVATRVELDGWEAEHAAGASLLDISTRLLALSTVDDTLRDDEFVSAMFLNGADRPADLRELYTWLFALDDGAETRAEVLLRFADSFIMQQHDGWYGATVHVADTEIGTLVRMYDALFDRAADQGGLNFWIGVSESGLGMADIADAFVGGAEGQFGAMSNAQYVAHLYQAGLERTASQAEVAGWAGMIDDGRLDRGDVLLAIVNSAEMAELVGVQSTSIDLL